MVKKDDVTAKGDGRWITITPLDPAIAGQMAIVLNVAAQCAREGDSGKALRLKQAHDEIRRILTESYPDEQAP